MVFRAQARPGAGTRPGHWARPVTGPVSRKTFSMPAAALPRQCRTSRIITKQGAGRRGWRTSRVRFRPRASFSAASRRRSASTEARAARSRARSSAAAARAAASSTRASASACTAPTPPPNPHSAHSRARLSWLGSHTDDGGGGGCDRGVGEGGGVLGAQVVGEGGEGGGVRVCGGATLVVVLPNQPLQPPLPHPAKKKILLCKTKTIFWHRNLKSATFRLKTIWLLP
jgi:hypothetical protein